MNRGFSLIEVLIVVATIAVIMGIMVPLMKSAMLRAEVGAVASDAKIVHHAFKQYYIDNDRYPGSANLVSFEPLVTEGYYDGRIHKRLEGDSADAYDAPDGNQEYWMEFTLKVDPTIRFVIGDSDNAPLAGGEFVDGVYMYKNGVMAALTSPIDLQ